MEQAKELTVLPEAKTTATKGQLGAWRRFTGTWAGIFTALAMFFNGFGWYEITDWRILLVGAVLSALLLIAGLAKDVTEIIKKKLG